jgi:hypothetical protein
MIGRDNHSVTYTPLEETWTRQKPIWNYLTELADILA